MWRIQKKEKFDIWENDLCSLKVQYEESKCRVYVNYKGYNVVVPMEICGFEDEIQERKIKYEVEGEKGILNSLSYVVEKDNLRLFCDMIFFFLTEHSLDRMLSNKRQARLPKCPGQWRNHPISDTELHGPFSPHAEGQVLRIL